VTKEGGEIAALFYFALGRGIRYRAAEEGSAVVAELTSRNQACAVSPGA
jgi:hypothetical protein